jgi:eukaryotic-like serine/threonine-protein kinase
MAYTDGPGWQLPGYEVERLLGVGGTGEVWLGRQLATGDPVALKRLRPDADPAAVASLRREAALLAALDSPHVLRLREVVDDGGTVVLALDHAGGGTLADLLARRGSLSPGEVVTVAAPLAAALAAAHAAGVVHGDVSPANVLLTDDGMPLLADLGVARLAGAVGGELEGTAEYVDPSVAAGADPSAASDVWGLGAVCHHLLAGAPPHDGARSADVLEAALMGERAPLGLLAPHAPRPLVDAVEQALAGDPSARPTAGELSARLRRACPAVPVRLGPAAPSASASASASASLRPPVAGAAAGRALPDDGDGSSGRAAASPGSGRVTQRLARPRSAIRPPEPPARRRRRSPVLVALGTVAVLLLATGVGWALGRGGPTAVALPQRHVVGSVGAGPGPGGRTPFGVMTQGAATQGAATQAPPEVRVPEPSSAAPEPAPSPADPDPPRVVAPAVPSGATAATTGWPAVLDGLDAVRSEAFASGDPDLLDEVYAPGPALTADRRALHRLVAAGQRAEGVRHVVRTVEPVTVGAASARLRVVDELSAYRLVDGGGRPVAQRPGRGQIAFEVRLAALEGAWRLVSVTRVAG